MDKQQTVAPRVWSDQRKHVCAGEQPAVAYIQQVSLEHSGVRGTMTLLSVRKGLDGRGQHGIKCVGIHFILMWVRQF